MEDIITLSRETYKKIKGFNRNQMQSFLQDIYKSAADDTATSNAVSLDMEKLRKEIGEIKGIGENRLTEIMAVIEKRVGIHLGGCDAYVNVAGGLKVNEPALDLGIVMALVSSFRNREIDSGTIIFGEVGLAGEVRAVSQPQQRINEAVKLGFDTCILPEVCLKNVTDNGKIKLIGVRNLSDALEIFV